jgi:hypothetical protein
MTLQSVEVQGALCRRSRLRKREAVDAVREIGSSDAFARSVVARGRRSLAIISSLVPRTRSCATPCRQSLWRADRRPSFHYLRSRSLRAWHPQLWRAFRLEIQPPSEASLSFSAAMPPNQSGRPNSRCFSYLIVKMFGWNLLREESGHRRSTWRSAVLDPWTMKQGGNTQVQRCW